MTIRANHDEAHGRHEFRLPTDALNESNLKPKIAKFPSSNLRYKGGSKLNKPHHLAGLVQNVLFHKKLTQAETG